MTYDEATQATITAFQAKHEINTVHGAVNDDGGNFAAFQAEYGVAQEYTGQEVLDWLGY